MRLRPPALQRGAPALDSPGLRICAWLTLSDATQDLFVRPASLHDVDVVLDLLAEAAAWTAARGQPNWPERFSYEREGLAHVRDATGHWKDRSGACHDWCTSLYRRSCAAPGGSS